MISVEQFAVFFLIFVRITAFTAASPLYTFGRVPNLVKIGISFLLTALIYPTAGTVAGVGDSLVYYFFLAVNETLYGLAFGFLTNLIFLAIKFSGQLIDLQIGFSMANYFDPVFGSSATVLGKFTYFLAFILFFSINGHHLLIEAIAASYRVVPIAGFNIAGGVALEVFTLFYQTIALGVQIAAPIILIIVFVDFIVGFIARTVPRLNIFILGLPLKILVGLAAFFALLPFLLRIYGKAFDNIIPEVLPFGQGVPLALLFAAEEKTEEATPKKKQEAKKKGQVLKSPDLNAALSLLAAGLLILFIGDRVYEDLQRMVIFFLQKAGEFRVSLSNVEGLALTGTVEYLQAVLPFFLVILVVGVLANLMQSGVIYAKEALKPQLKRINPLEGFKRIFAQKSFVELIKTFAKILILGIFGITFIKNNFMDIALMEDRSYRGIFPFFKGMMQELLFKIFLIVFAIGLLDFLYQRYDYRKSLRMTRHELKEELKQSEGDPKLKSWIRQRQRQIALNNIRREVPKATVVVTNPTHFAVALRYETGKDNAPVVVAKGSDYLAQRIKAIANEHHVPVEESPHLARFLYYKVDVGQDIPPEIYQAVAQILAVIYQDRRR